MNIWIFLSFLLGLILLIRFIIALNTSFAFRELFILLYGLNYLISPSIIYLLPSEQVFYKMRVPSEIYFPISFLGIFGLIVGTYFYKTTFFKPNINLLKVETILNERVLKQWFFIGIILSLFSSIFSSEIGFFIYLFSMIRYVGAFGLFILAPKKFWWVILVVMIIELSSATKYGMFHDMVMWMIFFVLIVGYYFKLGSATKLTLIIIGFLFYNVLQNSKSTYRDAISNSEESGISTFFEVLKKTNEIQENDKSFFQSQDFIGSITRINQAWILASTMDNMDRTSDFQGMNNVIIYLKSAFLPRFLAPDKLKSGDKQIFNRFSGNTLNEGTSMGLGIFADGYIAYGFWGVPIFGLALGLIFSLVFKIVEGWILVSPFYFLFILPILVYAIRPDCELQTILGHIVKSVFVYSLIVMIYKGYFRRKSIIIQKLIERGLVKL